MQKSDDLIKVRDRIYNKNRAPMVSIVCLTYNQEGFIKDAIEGFLDQKTTFQVEILIYDDASNDGTANIVKSYKQAFPEAIRTVFQDKNQFSISGDPEVNIVYPIARGKYIALCEGDDYWTDRNKLQKQVAILEANETYVLCVGGYTRLNQQTQEKRIVVDKRVDLVNVGGFEFSLDNMRDKWLTKTLTALFRRKTLNKFDLTVYNYRRDIHLFYHLMKNGKGFYLSENLGVYRIHPGGINSMRPSLYNSDVGYHCYKELYEENRGDFTREMYLKHTLNVFNMLLYKSSDRAPLFKLFTEALKLVRNGEEVKWLLSVFVRRDLKDKIKENFN